MTALLQQIENMTPDQRVALAEQLGVPVRTTDVLTAFVTGALDDPTSLRAALHDHLPTHMIPARFELLENFPTLPNGKIDLKQLEAHAPSGFNKVDAASSRVPKPNKTRLEAASTSGFSHHPSPVRRSWNSEDGSLSLLLPLWSRLLGGIEVAPDDNFFELGGHSLLVIELVDELAKKTGTRLRVPDVFRAPTPRGIAELLEPNRVELPEREMTHVFPIQPNGSLPPVFVIQPDFFSGILCDAVGETRPVFGLRAVGNRPDGNVGRWPTLTHLAQEMVEEIRATWPDGPYLIAGYSFGAVIAVEVARLFHEQGTSPERLILFDPTPWNIYHHGLLSLQFRTCNEAVTGLTLPQALGRWLADNHPLTNKPYRRLGRIFGNTPKRFLLQQRGKRRRDRGGAFTPAEMEADADYERFRLFFQHRPQPVTVPTLFFNADEPDTDALATWKPFLAGPLVVHQIPNLHLHLAGSPETRQQIVENLRAELGG